MAKKNRARVVEPEDTEEDETEEEAADEAEEEAADEAEDKAAMAEVAAEELVENPVTADIAAQRRVDHCPQCGATNVDAVPVERLRDYIQCPNCGHVHRPVDRK